MRSGGTTNTIFIVFDLTRPGMELAIYRTQGEHANHYTTVYTSHVRVLYSLLKFLCWFQVQNFNNYLILDALHIQEIDFCICLSLNLDIVYFQLKIVIL